MTHLRLTGAPAQVQRDALCDIARASRGLWRALNVLRDLDLPQGWIVSGAIYNQVWNHLTGRPDMYGVKDIDIFYFDPDPGAEAEDRVGARVAAALPGPPPAETRNVFRWREVRYANALQPVADFPCRAYCVAMQLDASDRLHVHAPYGLDDIFGFRITPNRRPDSRSAHPSKAVRQMRFWPELSLIARDGGD